MKKIVYIAQSAGGVAEYLYMLLKNFKNKEYESILIVSEDYNEQLERFKPYVSHIYIIPMIRELNLKTDIKAILELKKRLKKIRPDIVYLNSSKAGGIGRLALLFDFRVKILYNAHGWYFSAKISDKKKKLFALMEKILALKTTKIINISKAEQESALKYKIAPKKKMTIIENGIDFSRFDNCDVNRKETRNKYNIKEDDIVIGVVGRISEQKDPMTSIQAFKIVKEKYPNTKLLMVGSGELEEDVIKYAKDNAINQDVIITGWVNCVEEYIPAFDIAILPSKWEGFGLVIVEYMACDKPIIASNVGGIANIITNEENGLLVNCEDYKMLADKIEKIITDKAMTEKIIARNKEYRKKYDISEFIKKYSSEL